ncbi:hypothetical protein CDAR_211281 [Caerostris darwini]|uniref:Uncharacterized protein n=1 Tax=Caerostris darwini TaxID=1538125 RepID=A0AAV4W109_9ARAC|nr:hypothetical protein CDAR_211281 [Caerostris darwini]
MAKAASGIRNALVQYASGAPFLNTPSDNTFSGERTEECLLTETRITPLPFKTSQDIHLTKLWQHSLTLTSVCEERGGVGGGR